MSIDSHRRLIYLPIIGQAEQDRLLGLARNIGDSSLKGALMDLDEQDESQLDLLLLRLSEEGELDS